MAPNIPFANIPTLLVEQTIESLVYKKFVDDFKNPLLKPFMYLDVLKLRLWEEHYWKSATRLVAMSEEDKEIMAEAAPKQKIDVVANGVDIPFFTSANIVRPDKPTILFVGNFKWLPNKDAAKFLTYQIWPKIKREIKNARLWIVGRSPTKEILQLGKLIDVDVTENIEDIRDAFGRATVLLAPIRNGRGTKYKVLEAMAMKLPVVTTSLGIEGIDAVDNKEVLIKEDVENIAAATIKLLNDSKLRKRLSDSAFQLIKEKYNWQIVSKSLDEIYQSIGKE
jgi:glycosyltransferase involved in cell wall biosynthesis